MSTAADLLEFLTAEEEDGKTTATDLLALARAKILAGGGQLAVMTSGTANGKSFTFDIRLDAAQLANICRQAIASAEGDEVISSGLDFSALGTLD
jgi:hypothetical protein